MEPACRVEAVIDEARGKVEQLQLTVVSSNAAAIQLYSKLGFVGYGLEKRALRVDGQYFDEMLMAGRWLSGARHLAQEGAMRIDVHERRLFRAQTVRRVRTACGWRRDGDKRLSSLPKL
ncbi:GNAT family N-acetyltransferase [Ensifer adhaerens]|uniref:GNAT family N-acetyltransferase n=1 Tax=Ensifer adhaerens TaxID=106592 RepID=UPI00069FDE10|nr:GNAT family N-acetyltransferase [Ensifer adhaerens]